VLFGTIALIVLSFWSLDLQLARVLSLESLARMGKFLGELLSPNLEPVFLSKLLRASLETLAMSAVGTLLATIFGLLLAVPARPRRNGQRPSLRTTDMSAHPTKCFSGRKDKPNAQGLIRRGCDYHGAWR
jgi:ABC-type phosphate/phosphonate transport system permease subunit